jgi:hypothetical protein
VEKPVNNSIGFLDIQIISKEGHLAMGIHLKDVGHPLYQRWDSDKPCNMKVAGLQALAHRAFRLPIEESARYNEIRRLTSLAKGCHIPLRVWTSMVQRAINSAIIKPAISGLRKGREKPQGIGIPIPWENGRWKAITPLLRKMGYYPMWKPGRTIQQILPKYKGPEPTPIQPIKRAMNPIHLTGGIYKLQCDGCPALYLGQTKCFFDRLAQHVGDTRQLRKHGAVTTHYVNQHKFRGFQQQNQGESLLMEPLWITNNQATRNMIESVGIQIANSGGEILNKEPGPAGTTLISQIAQSAPHMNVYIREGGAIPPLWAAPTKTRNNIVSCEGATLAHHGSSSADAGSSVQVQLFDRAHASSPHGVRRNPDHGNNFRGG